MSPLFKVHRLNETGMERAARIATSFDALLTELEAVCPDSREMSIVRTKLEEACFFAKKAMANNPTSQESK